VNFDPLAFCEGLTKLLLSICEVGHYFDKYDQNSFDCSTYEQTQLDNVESSVSNCEVTFTQHSVSDQ